MRGRLVGTNYYYHKQGRCAHCGRTDDGLHIGKSSAGWRFALRVHKYDGINSLADWEALWKSGGIILDEYGDDVPADEMLKMITQRSHPNGLRAHTGENMGPYWHAMNVDVVVMPGNATYDLCNYEFS